MIKNTFIVDIILQLRLKSNKACYQRRYIFVKLLLESLSVDRGLTALDAQKRMAIKGNGCTVKGEEENVSAPIV